jgi:hypothetical protein
MVMLSVHSLTDAAALNQRGFLVSIFCNFRSAVGESTFDMPSTCAVQQVCVGLVAVEVVQNRTSSDLNTSVREPAQSLSRRSVPVLSVHSTFMAPVLMVSAPLDDDSFARQDHRAFARCWK